MPPHRLYYNGYKFVTTEPILNVVCLQNTTPNQFSRFFERLDDGDKAGKGFDSFDEFWDAMTIAIDLKDERFQDMLTKELHMSLLDSDEIVPRKIETDEQVDLIVEMVLLVYDYGAPHFWKDLFIAAVARGITTDRQPAMVNLKVLSKLMEETERLQKLKNKFIPSLLKGLRAHQSYNEGKEVISLMPVDDFLYSKSGNGS